MGGVIFVIFVRALTDAEFADAKARLLPRIGR
jgi:hypothetical protein